MCNAITKLEILVLVELLKQFIQYNWTIQNSIEQILFKVLNKLTDIWAKAKVTFEININDTKLSVSQHILLYFSSAKLADDMCFY